MHYRNIRTATSSRVTSIYATNYNLPHLICLLELLLIFLVTFSYSSPLDPKDRTDDALEHRTSFASRSDCSKKFSIFDTYNILITRLRVL